MKSFSQKMRVIGVNPYVTPPETVLKAMFRAAGKDRGPIPVRGTIHGASFKQTLVKYKGSWRLYINGPMLRGSGLKVGDTAHIKIEHDPTSRVIPMHPKFKAVLTKRPRAKMAFEKLAPHRKKEILRYLRGIKSQETLQKNIDTILRHLQGYKVTHLTALLRVKK